MTKKKTQIEPEPVEMFPPEDMAKPQTEDAANADNPDLNDVVGAMEEGSAISKEDEAPESTSEAPDIQDEGDFPTAEDAYADMSKPPPEAPLEFSELKHSSQVPQQAFRSIPQDKYISLFMFNLPFGTAEEGEEFTHAVAANLLNQLAKECPHLAPRRYEIRLLLLANGSYRFLEVPADPLKTKAAETARRTLLDVLKVAERKWVLAVKKDGIWSPGDAGYCETPFKEPHQSYKKLVDLTYGRKIHRNLNAAVFRRYRRKVCDGHR
jgi:hypothetical protein